MRDQVGHELDDRNLVDAELERQTKDRPEGREEDHGDEDEHELPRGPVRQVASPHLGKVHLDGGVGDHLLLLTLDQQVQKRHVLVV